MTCCVSTTCLKCLSVATSIVTFDDLSRSETRVQSVIAFVEGKPDETPWRNLPCVATGRRLARAIAE